MKKRKVLLVLALTTIITVAFALFWQWESGTIDYWLEDAMKYQIVDGRWETVNCSTGAISPGIFIPINCRNDGFTTASFDLIISFKNAIYKGSPDNPKLMIDWEKINDTVAKYSYTLSPHATQSVNVYFQIENETDTFEVRLAFQSNQLLRVESAQKGSQPWQTVYRTLYFGKADTNSYLAAHIS
jgi:hypothetical protein